MSLIVFSNRCFSFGPNFVNCESLPYDAHTRGCIRTFPSIILLIMICRVFVLSHNILYVYNVVSTVYKKLIIAFNICVHFKPVDASNDFYSLPSLTNIEIDYYRFGVFFYVLFVIFWSLPALCFIYVWQACSHTFSPRVHLNYIKN